MTAGLAITPELPKMPIIKGIILRPEIRWDSAVDGAQPFFRPSGRKSSQGLVMFGAIVPFSLL